MSRIQLKPTLMALSVVLSTACSDGGEAAGAAAPAAPAADQGAPAAPAAFPAPARAQLQDGAPASGELVLDQHRQLVRFGATMHAAADFCEMDYDDAERERLRRQQREAMVGMGAITAAQFDAAFDAGIGQAREAFTRAPPAELRGMCDDLLRLRGATPQG